MSNHQLIAVFEHEDDLLAAARLLREQDYRIIDAYTPYAVHGLDQALGLRPSRLTWVCFLCGMFGTLGMLWFQYWVGAVSWRVNVGGKPWNSLPSTMPVTFESGVLLAGFGSVFALLGVSRLYPGKKAQPEIAGVTDHRFVLVIDEADARCDAARVRNLLTPLNLVELTEWLAPAEGR